MQNAVLIKVRRWQPMAGQRNDSLYLMKMCPLQFTLAIASGGLSLSR
jgi:hypothetical protein